MTAFDLVPWSPLHRRATDAEREAYAELDELAAQWKALSEWDRLERRRSEYRHAGPPGTCTVSFGPIWMAGGPGGMGTVTVQGIHVPDLDDAPPSTLRSPPPSEEPFPLTPERRTRPKRPSWFDLALGRFAFSPPAQRRSSGHANADAAELPHPGRRDRNRH